MSSSLAGRANPTIDILLDVPLSFEAGAERVHAPMVAARIGGNAHPPDASTPVRPTTS